MGDLRHQRERRQAKTPHQQSSRRLPTKLVWGWEVDLLRLQPQRRRPSLEIASGRRRGGPIEPERRLFCLGDSQWVYYTKNWWDSPLWRVPRDGGEETQVLESVYLLAFAIVKEGIYFIPKPDSAGRYSIQFFNSTTKRIRSVSSIEGPIGNDLSVSLDGRRILYSQIDQAGSDLMLVDHFR